MIKVLTNQRVGAGIIDVVRNQHQIAGRKIQVNTSACIGQNNLFYAQQSHDPDRNRNYLLRMALIIVESSLKRNNRLALARANDECTCMPLNGRLREIGDLSKRNNDPIFETVSKITQTTA